MASFAPFEARPRIALAVSGGSDSLCLAAMAARWTRHHSGEARAFIVDHALRPGSAEDAEQARLICETLSVPAEILRWEHPPIERAIQQQARDARYALLDRAVGSWPALHLLMAHHAGDQQETISMRAARGSGPMGLSGMSAVVEREQLRVFRPLLAIPKSRLVATLHRDGIAWIDDPSNDNPRFLRARLRSGASAMWQPPCDPSARLSLDADAAAFLGQHARLSRTRLVQFDREMFRRLTAGTGRHLLGRILTSLVDRRYLPANSSLDRLQTMLFAHGNGAMTLGGCIIRSGKRWVRVRPEQVRVSPWRPPVAVAPAPFGSNPSSAGDLASLAK